MKARAPAQGPLENGVAALHHRRLACGLEALAHELAREGNLTLPLEEPDDGPIVRADGSRFCVPVVVGVGHAEATIAWNDGHHHGFPARMRAAERHICVPSRRIGQHSGANVFPLSTFPLRGTRPRKDEQRAVASCATGAPAKGKSALTPKPRSNAVVGRSQFKTWVPAQFSQERRGPKARGPEGGSRDVQIRDFGRARGLLCRWIFNRRFVVESTRYQPAGANLCPRRLREQLARASQRRRKRRDAKRAQHVSRTVSHRTAGSRGRKRLSPKSATATPLRACPREPAGYGPS